MTSNDANYALFCAETVEFTLFVVPKMWKDFGQISTLEEGL